MSQLIYKNGCWTCKRAIENPTQEYTCPKTKEHLIDYQKEQENQPGYFKSWTNQPIFLSKD